MFLCRHVVLLSLQSCTLRRAYDVVIVHLGSNDLSHYGYHSSVSEGIMALASISSELQKLFT